AIAQRLGAFVIGEAVPCRLRRCGEPGDAGEVFASGAAAALLAAAADHRRDLDRATDEQGTDPRRAAELMGGQADEIGADCNNIDRDLPGGLHRVAME